MWRWTAALLLAGCVWVQVSAQEQSTQQQAPAVEQKADQSDSSQSAPKPPAPGTSAAPANMGDFSLDKYTDFSALMTGSIAPSGDYTGHIYRSRNLMRIEGNAGIPNYFITDLEKQENHGLSATGCIGMGHPHSRSFPFMLAGPETKYETTPAGEETVDGHACRVEDVTISSPRFKQPFILRIWRAEDLRGFPVKIENRRPGARPWSIHYTNVVLGPQDSSLFVVPNKCESFGLPDKAGASPAPKSKKPAKKPE